MKYAKRMRRTSVWQNKTKQTKQNKIIRKLHFSSLTLHVMVTNLLCGWCQVIFISQISNTRVSILLYRYSVFLLLVYPKWSQRVVQKLANLRNIYAFSLRRSPWRQHQWSLWDILGLISPYCRIYASVNRASIGAHDVTNHPLHTSAIIIQRRNTSVWNLWADMPTLDLAPVILIFPTLFADFLFVR